MSADQNLDHLMDRNKDWRYSSPVSLVFLRKSVGVCVFQFSEVCVQFLVRVMKSDAKL